MFSCQDLQLFSLNPIVQLPESVRVFHGSAPRPSTAEMGKRAEQQPRMELNNRRENRSVGKGLNRLTDKPTLTLTIMQAYSDYLNDTDCRLYNTRGKHSHNRTRNHTPNSSQALNHDLPSCSFPTLAKPPSRLEPGLTWHLLFYSTMLAGMWPQQSRKPVSQEKGISVFVLGSWASLVGCICNNAKYLSHAKQYNVKNKNKKNQTSIIYSDELSSKSITLECEMHSFFLMNCLFAPSGNASQASFDLEGAFFTFLLNTLVVSLVGELPQVQLGDVHQCVTAAQQTIDGMESFYWWNGADKLERQHFKMRFGFVSSALAGARTVALYSVHP